MGAQSRKLASEGGDGVSGVCDGLGVRVIGKRVAEAWRLGDGDWSTCGEADQPPTLLQPARETERSRTPSMTRLMDTPVVMERLPT